MLIAPKESPSLHVQLRVRLHAAGCWGREFAEGLVPRQASLWSMPRPRKGFIWAYGGCPVLQLSVCPVIALCADMRAWRANGIAAMSSLSAAVSTAFLRSCRYTRTYNEAGWRAVVCRVFASSSPPLSSEPSIPLKSGGRASDISYVCTSRVYLVDWWTSKLSGRGADDGVTKLR
jgi:hypothetical protein